MTDKLSCWEVKVQWKEMDMSGGDVVDGPRWTGKRYNADRSLMIVALNVHLAEACALSLFYEHSDPKIVASRKMFEIDGIVRHS